MTRDVLQSLQKALDRPEIRDSARWLRANLFSSWTNTLLTLATLCLSWLLLTNFIDWAILSATFTGSDGAACARPGAGACWPFITHKLDLFLYGRYPAAQHWRVDLTYALALVGIVPLMIPRVPGKLWFLIYVLAIFPILAFVLLVGGVLGLPRVGTELWGGLLVTLVVATTGIVAALPIGVALALGRRSKMPIIRFLSVGLIEMVRGVPLITVLFFATYMLPLFLERSPDAMVRVLVGVSIFSGAYMAETIRGGLQAIPKGQFEGAMALGLNYPRMMSLIVMPQALKLVIPGIVNSFIGLFKDTTLVSIVAIFDLLGGIRAGFTDPQWATPVTLYTGFAFAGIIYFAFCYFMSRYSIFVENRLNTGRRR
jgi:general L-amino acid transport system permease protein